MKRIFLLFAAIFLSSNTWAIDKSAENLFIKAQALVVQSRAGDDSVTAQALHQFTNLSMAYPDNPLFLAYQGSLHTLTGRDAWMPWNKIAYTEKGLDMISKALRMLKLKHDHEKIRGAPISVETRLVAVSTFSSVPASFHHFEKAKAVLNELFQSPVLTVSPPYLQAYVYKEAAKIARMENQRYREIRYLQRVLKVEPKGKFAQAARKRLWELKK